MNMERAALRGQKAVAEHDLKEFKKNADGMRSLLHIELPKYLDVATLDREKIATYAAGLVSALSEIAELMAKLKSIEEELDG